MGRRRHHTGRFPVSHEAAKLPTRPESINAARQICLRHSITIAALTALACAPAPAAAQTVLDWPLVLEARPGPLVAGAGAVLGNPAGTAELNARAEGLVSDLETPSEMGLSALSLAGAVRLFEGWSVSVAYRHIGLGDMLRTDGPPVGGPGDQPTPTFEVAEDVYTVGVAVRAREFGAGFAARLDTPAEGLGGGRSWAGTGGVVYTPTLGAVALRVAATMEVDRDDPSFAGALEGAAPLLLEDRLRLALAYGLNQPGPIGVEHSIVTTGVWRGLTEIQVGAVGHPGADDTAWAPLLAALLHLGRYRVGIVREHLPNGFGAAMHYRLSVVF